MVTSSTCRRIQGVFLAFLALVSGVQAAERLVMGVVPQQSATRLAQIWTPILDRVSAVSGFTLVFETAKDIPTFEERLREGRYDVAYMNPYHFTVFNEEPGYQALVRRDGQPIKGLLVVQKESPIRTLSDLNGKGLAFPAPAAFAATVIPRSMLKQQGIAITPHYVSSHDSVYLAVSKGLFPAGGGVQRTLNAMAPEVRERLRILWTSEGYTPHAIATRPGMEESTRDALRLGFEALNGDPEGRALLDTIQVRNGFVRAENSDWDDVRQLGIRLLEAD